MTTSPSCRKSDEIMIVSGLPRSGTSLMMQMLSAAGLPILQDDARKPDDSNPRGYFELAAVRASQRDTAWVDRAPGHAVKVIHALLPHLPRNRQYRVILMERPIAQVILSQNRMLEAADEPTDPLPTGRLESVLIEQLDETRRLLDTEDCFDWIAVDYPALVSDPLTEAHRVIDFLGLSCSDSSLSSVVEPDLFRNRA